jgi:hypothetical protein
MQRVRRFCASHHKSLHMLQIASTISISYGFTEHPVRSPIQPFCLFSRDIYMQYEPLHDTRVLRERSSSEGDVRAACCGWIGARTRH